MDIDRLTAYQALLKIEKDQAYSNIVLNHLIEENKPKKPPFVRELTYGVLEKKYYLDYLIGQLAKKKPKKEPLTLIRMGIYQMQFMDSVPDHAAVDEMVEIAKKNCRSYAGLVNGVLRNFRREQDSLRQPSEEKDPVIRLSALYSCEPWIIRLWMEQYGEERTEELLAASIEAPPMMIRVNMLRTSPTILKEKLKRKHISVQEVKGTKRSLILEGRDILSLTEYQDGLFSVQDASSVIAMETLVDVCAAPFGKTLACAEIMANQGEIRAFDLHENKVSLLEDSAKRLGITIATAEAHDATELIPELIGAADCVICDVPCSGLGVIRRKPEIKYKRIEDNGRELARLQLQILETASAYVKTGGSLLYSTCTINSVENRDVVQKFLRTHMNFAMVRTRQLLPTADGTDGFYFCKLKKKYEA
jgi:16S rRNA (cytosine967-C5)-methyltransferase